jgi:hypothetical protein
MRQALLGRRVIQRSVGSVLVALFMIGLVLSMGGCARRTVVVKDSGGDVVYVQTAPPAPKVETRPARPVPGAVWVSGHWKWNGHRYVWISGHWDRTPRSSAWVPGHWEKRPRGWVWIPGHWR